MKETKIITITMIASGLNRCLLTIEHAVHKNFVFAGMHAVRDCLANGNVPSHKMLSVKSDSAMASQWKPAAPLMGNHKFPLGSL